MRGLLLPVLPVLAVLALSLGSCSAAGQSTPEMSSAAEFEEGWAMSFLPGTDLLAVTERGGALKLRNQVTGEISEVSGTPEVRHEGQGGMHDIIAGPDFPEDRQIYLSWVRAHGQDAQGVVGRATLDLEEQVLRDLEVLWEQPPAPGSGHFSLRLLIQDEHLFITSGDRQGGAEGAVLRMPLDGDSAPERWTTGSRNILGIDEDAEGRIWITEMGPRGGDELNLLIPGEDYGWPEVSMGSHYDGTPIPDHAPGDGFHPPAAHWNPSISPANLLIYSGELAEDWRDNALIGGLSGEKILRVALGEPAEVLEEWDMGERIRALAEAPNGSIWVLEDGDGGRLYQWFP